MVNHSQIKHLQTIWQIKVKTLHECQGKERSNKMHRGYGSVVYRDGFLDIEHHPQPRE